MAVIEVKNVWKKYRLYYEKTPSLKETILFRGRGKWEDFWVLKDINLEIEKGVTVGLIGQNGSGKSTLLKLLTKIIYPNKGNINIAGRVSSLLELGAGFHPDFTGRENIYFNSSVFGLTKKEIDNRIDEIIEFSELEEFIDNPVRSYSSGMYMRLAFATAINVDPDILLIDEVLAVGDTAFQKKCLEKINEFKSRGKTIVFVSHDHGVVERLCDTAVWLHDGQISEVGNTRKVIDAYLLKLAENDDKRLSSKHKQQNEIVSVSAKKKLEENESQSVNIENRSNRWGTREIEISDVQMLDINNKERYVFECGEPVLISIRYKVNSPGEYCPVFGVGIYRSDGLHCYGTNTEIDQINFREITEQGLVKFDIKELNLIEGSYSLAVAVVSPDGHPYDYHTKRLVFETYSKTKDIGVVRLRHSWELR